MKNLTIEEGEKLIIEILINHKTHKMTTWEIDREIRQRESDCPDEIVRFLAKMRHKGIIKGEVSMEARGWVWWVE